MEAGTRRAIVRTSLLSRAIGGGRYASAGRTAVTVTERAITTTRAARRSMDVGSRRVRRDSCRDLAHRACIHAVAYAGTAGRKIESPRPREYHALSGEARRHRGRADG